ncbi:hypothetical protein [Winogradskyella vidalii]|uniref:hypothetical protein n=1 Tax=Winogradskyella vidalii TaxID=2615024 RepID=UPI0015C6EC89|nr:hypothetical protein [Winogradskyella vidalii]
MKTTLTYILFGVLSILVLSWGVNHEEDKSKDLVFNKKVIDGDIIFRSVTTENTALNNFNEFGIVEKYLDKMYVWDNQNTMRISFKDWVRKGNNGHVKVYSIKSSDFNINTLKLQNGTYDHVMNSDVLEFITENKLEK